MQVLDGVTQQLDLAPGKVLFRQRLKRKALAKPALGKSSRNANK
jgi:hypothetical protein